MKLNYLLKEHTKINTYIALCIASFMAIACGADNNDAEKGLDDARADTLLDIDRDTYTEPEYNLKVTNVQNGMKTSNVHTQIKPNTGENISDITDSTKSIDIQVFSKIIEFQLEKRTIHKYSKSGRKNDAETVSKGDIAKKDNWTTDTTDLSAEGYGSELSFINSDGSTIPLEKLGTSTKVELLPDGKIKVEIAGVDQNHGQNTVHRSDNVSVNLSITNAAGEILINNKLVANNLILNHTKN